LTKLKVRPDGSLQSIEIAFDDQGAGPVIVLLHGFPFNRTLWEEQVNALKEKHRVITLDLRGHGESEVKGEAVSMEEMAKDVAGLLDKLEIKRAAIAGLSMGGYVALAFWRLFPMRVRALILADTRAGADTDEGKQNRSVQAEKAVKEGMDVIVSAMLPKLFSSNTVERQPAVVKRVKEMMLATDAVGAAAALLGMAERHDQRPFLEEIIAPVLIIVGREDAITPVSESESMHRLIAGSRLEILEGAGHVSNMERPAEFNRCLLDFLQDIEAI
jgi:3-oxoadipate enol-lactonase